MKKFDEITYPILIINKGKIVYVNTSTSILLGYEKKDIIGKDIKDFIGKGIEEGKSYVDIGRFKKKEGSFSTYAYTISPLKEEDKNYTIIELKGLDIGTKILTHITEKKYVWKDKDIIELIAKESLAPTHIDRLRIYNVKKEGIRELEVFYEYLKKPNKSIWKNEFCLNKLPIHTLKDFERFSDVWITLKKEEFPEGLREVIKKDNIKFLIAKAIYINPRTIYVLSYEKMGAGTEISSLEINLFLYTYQLFKELLVEKAKEKYFKALSELRKNLLSIDTREELILTFSKCVPIAYDRIVMGSSLENEEEFGILIKDKGSVKRVVLPISEKASLSEIIQTVDYSTERVDYAIMNMEKLGKLKGSTARTLLDRLSVKATDSILVISLKGKEGSKNFIWLLKREENYYSHLDFEQLDLFVKEILLVLQKFRIMEEAKEEKLRAENALKVQKFFLERISHEFRTPITGILGFSELLSEIVKSEEGIEYLNAVKDSTTRLLNLVDKLLLLTRLEAGYFVPREGVFNFAELEMWLREKLKKDIKPGLTYTIHMPFISHPLVGDLDKIKTVFKELIENAIKFTNEGRIDICGEIIEEDADSIKVRFSIKDTGVGIAEDKLRYIFSNFAQEEEDITRSYEGMGLGLSVAKKIIKILNGTIWVESNKEKGSVFYFELKLKREIKDELFQGKRILVKAKEELISSLLKVYITSIKAIPVFEEREGYDIVLEEKDIVLPITKKEIKYILWKKGRGLSKKINRKEVQRKILVAEDNPLNYKYIKMILESLNLAPENAKNGKEAVEMFKQKPYDLIIMDIQMPIMDGIEATRHIRKTNKKIPIIALTAAAVEEVENKAKEAGINEYVTKPFTKEKLIETIAKYIDING